MVQTPLDVGVPEVTDDAQDVFSVAHFAEIVLRHAWTGAVSRDCMDTDDDAAR